MKTGTIVIARQTDEAEFANKTAYIPSQIQSGNYRGRPIQTIWTVQSQPNGPFAIEIFRSNNGNIRGRLLSPHVPKEFRNQTTSLDAIKFAETGIESLFPEISTESVFSIEDFQGTGAALVHNGKPLKVSSRLKIGSFVDYLRREQRAGFTLTATEQHYDLVHKALAHTYSRHGIPVIPLVRKTELHLAYWRR
jgi:hypothetical protein